MPNFRSTLRVFSLALCPVAMAVAVPGSAVAQVASNRPTSTVASIQVIAEGPDQSVFAMTVSPKVGSFSTVNTDPVKPAVLLLRAARSPNIG